MENKDIVTNIGSEITKAKMDKYSYDEHNFVGDGEITVTITLAEYRTLVTSVAEKEKRELQNEVWKLKERCSELQKELECVKKYMLGNPREVEE